MAKVTYDLIQSNNRDLGEIVIKILDPIGGAAETWTLSNCKIERIDFGRFDWRANSELKAGEKVKEVGDISVTISFESVKYE